MHASLRATSRQCCTQTYRFASCNASTVHRSTNPYPYPSHSNPTPHQIFHLPLSASQQEVKSRYYELVRIYHPDSPISRAYPPEITEARFHAISTSYDVLRGRRTHDPDSPDASLQPRVDLHALWRAKQRLRQDPLEPADDRWKDGILLGSVVASLGAFVYQVTASRQKKVDDVFQSSKRSGAERTGFRRASEQSHDVLLLTDPNSDSPDDTPLPPR